MTQSSSSMTRYRHDLWQLRQNKLVYGKNVIYHVISPMFVNMRHPHVIQAIREDSPVARPTSGWGSVGGVVSRVALWKIVKGIRWTCSPRLIIAIIRLKLELGRHVCSLSNGCCATPGNRRDPFDIEGKQACNNHVSCLCYYRESDTFLRILRGEYDCGISRQSSQSYFYINEKKHSIDVCKMWRIANVKVPNSDENKSATLVDKTGFEHFSCWNHEYFTTDTTTGKWNCVREQERQASSNPEGISAAISEHAATH